MKWRTEQRWSWTPWRRGVALVAVLAVLTLLAMLAAAFAVMLQIDVTASRVQTDVLQAELLGRSAAEHAAALVLWDAGTCAARGLETPPAYSGLVRRCSVRDTRGAVVGHYTVRLEDESGKLDLSALPALWEATRDDAAGRGRLEQVLGAGATRATLRLLLGRDLQPGLAQVDDDGNGVVDDAPEYDAAQLRGDDAACACVADVARRVRAVWPSPARAAWSFCTVRGHVENVDDLRDPPPVALNACSTRDLARVLRARRDAAMMDSRYVSQLAATLVDFRDENHVVSTHAGAYGIEAVCFNEILANDGSYMCEPYYGKSGIPRDGGMSIEPKEAYVVGLQIDPYNKSSNPLAQYPMRPVAVARRGDGVEVTYSDSPRAHRDLTRCLRRRGLTDAGDNIRYPNEFWKNAHMIFRTEEGQATIEEDYNLLPKVLSSSAHQLVVESRWGPGKAYQTFDTLEALRTNNNAKTGFWLDNHWERCWGTYTVHPRVSDWAIVEAPQARTYYHVYIGNQPFTPTGFKGNAPDLDCDGNAARDSGTDEQLLKWEYQQGAPLRSDRLGFVDLVVTSSRRCNYAGWWNREMFNLAGGVNNSKSIWTQAILMRADVVELVNVSDQPVSIANWRVMVNTGSMVKELSRVTGSFQHDPRRGKSGMSGQALLASRGHAYLTTDAALFDLDYGDGSGTWGDASNEQVPLMPLPAADWGIWYRISGFRAGTRNLWDPGHTPGRDAQIVLEGAQFKPGEMAGEIVMFRSDRTSYAGNDLNGFTRMITGNSRGAIEILYGAAVNADSDIRVGDYAIIYGLPRAGGFVSLTLRNEYNQLAARMTEYGQVRHSDYGFSTGMRDATVEQSWATASRPTFGGTDERAGGRGAALRSTGTVRNRPLRTLADALQMHSRRPELCFSSGHGARAFVRAVGPVVRLGEHVLQFEHAEQAPHAGDGWQCTLATVAVARGAAVLLSAGAWEAEQWKGQMLSVLHGAQAGERWPILSSGPRSITTTGRSAPGDQPVQLSKGDTVMVGPPYRTPMYVTRRGAARGVWEWQTSGLTPGAAYRLHLFGLNDAIVTTEFLEENHNARLAVEVWNHEAARWELLGDRLRYDKSDGVDCGQLRRAHIGARGALRLAVTAHELDAPQASGMAWLDYLVLTPRETPGQVNVNTADARVLAALPHVTPQLAGAIVHARGAGGLRDVYALVGRPQVDARALAAASPWLTTRGDTFRATITSSSGATQRPTAYCARTVYLERRRDADGGWRVRQALQ